MRRTWVPILLALGIAAGTAVNGQQILLDDTVQVAGLTLYRDLRDETVYYYLPNRPRLALNERGEPAFSFTRWVKNVRTAGDAEVAREGEGGGFVHFLVELTVPDDALERARRELRRVKPGATIQGAVGFRGGRMALVASEPSEDGPVTEVIGVGPAPLLGGRAGVMMTLSKDGARIFWQAFQEHDSPPLVFSFMDMEVAGFRQKTGVVIHADLEKIHNHKSFAAGVAGTYFGADIEAAFDQLRESGAITEEWIGEDQGFETLIGQTYRQLLLELFEPVPDLQALPGASAPAAGSGGMLGKANAWLKERRAEPAEPSAKPPAAAARESRPAASGGGTSPDSRAKATAAEERAKKAEAKATEVSAKLRKLREQISEAEKATGDGAPSAEKIAKAKEMAAAYDKQVTVLRAQAVNDKAEAARLRAAGSVPVKPEKPEVAATSGAQAPSGEGESKPAITVLASFRMKKRSLKKELVISLNRHRSDTVPERFDGEIGRVGDCRSCFLEINLDDPLYVQREIFVYLDGLQPEYFEKSVNFASVQLRKRHASGAITDDEVRIDRRTLESTGNRFKLLYGWKGDNDRERWLDYEYRVVWSFFGGHSTEEPWRRTTDGAINLAPPLVPRGVSLASNADAMAEAEVRLVTVRLYYDLGGGERVETVSLRPELGELAARVDLLRPRDASEYDYEIEWTLRGNRSLTTGRRTTGAGTLFLDELPTG